MTHTSKITALAVAGALSIFGAAGLPGAAHAHAGHQAAPCQQAGTLTVDGPERVAESPAAGVGACLSFDGTAGDTMTVGIYHPGAGGERIAFWSNLVVRDPAGQVIASFQGGHPQVDPIYRLPLPRLATTGTYQVEVAPASPDMLVSARVLLNSVTDLGRVEIDGPGRPVHLKRVGQEQRITFAGRADQWVQLDLSGFDFASGVPGREPGVWIEIWSADKTRLLFRDVLRGDGRRELGPLRLTSDFVLQAWTVWGSVGGVTVSVPSMPRQG
ncbi:hypothetical protein [Nonomuraea lactucae]|uniref:hypothetical protein n=1 Tax=Nonomuraea lactucae TaxID=2249762 RepID=UPI000DE24D08|nr:hypothetical protein [Nonomuraea lactucae]